MSLVQNALLGESLYDLDSSKKRHNETKAKSKGAKKCLIFPLVPYYISIAASLKGKVSEQPSEDMSTDFSQSNNVERDYRLRDRLETGHIQ